MYPRGDRLISKAAHSLFCQGLIGARTKPMRIFMHQPYVCVGLASRGLLKRIAAVVREQLSV